jgi:hypothetical protein
MYVIRICSVVISRTVTQLEAPQSRSRVIASFAAAEPSPVKSRMGIKRAAMKIRLATE